MIPPKYRFYIGTSLYMYISDSMSIDDNGNEISNASSKLYASYKNAVPDTAKELIVDFNSTNSFNSAFFYSASGLISKVSLSAKLSKIDIPAGAVYFAVRFTAEDPVFNSKKNSQFIYMGQGEIYPHYKDLSIKYAKENGQEFFRANLDGKMNLFGADYDIVKSASIESKFIFLLYKEGKSGVYFKGTFNKNDCKYDFSKKKCELKITPLDEYSDITDGYENTYDLIKLSPEISHIRMCQRALLQAYVKGSNTIANFAGGTYWESDVNEAVNSHDQLVSKYAFALVQRANEFTINDCSYPGVNGTYAGTNGRWTNWETGFTCVSEATGEYDNDDSMWKIRLYIKDKNGTNLYTDVARSDDKNGSYISLQERSSFRRIGNESADVCYAKNQFLYEVYMRLLCNVNKTVNGTPTYDLPYDDFAVGRENYKKCIGIVAGSVFCSSAAVAEPTKYGMNDYKKYFTNQFLSGIAGDGRLMPITRNAWANAALWFRYSPEYFAVVEPKLRKYYSLKDAYSIADAIKALLKKIDPSLKHEATIEYSRFLYDETVPVDMNRFYVYLTAKSNILKGGNYDQAAQKAEISLENLMKMLRDCFRCYWYIEDGKFKVEHISYFMNGMTYSPNLSIQLDMTNIRDRFNGKEILYFQSELEYDKSNLSSRYEFGWMDDVTDIFGGTTIDVTSQYVQKDKKESINVSQFCSDVDYMMFSPSDFSKDGFALLCPIKETRTEIVENKYAGDGYISLPDRNVVNLSQDWKYTDYIRVEKGQRLEVSTYTKSVAGATPELIIDLYDANKNPVYSFVTLQAKKTEYSLVVPDQAAYARFSVNFGGGPVNYGNVTPQIRIVNPDELHLPITEKQLSYEEVGAFGETVKKQYTAYAQNGYASWPYLVRFYMYDMPGSSVVCNSLQSLRVNSIKNSMRHTVQIQTEQEINEKNLIRTGAGNARIDEMSIKLDTELTKLRLAYKPS